jgi:hypothetical protein
MTFALLVAAFPPALIWLAVGRRPRRQWLAAVVAGLLGLLQGSTLAILAWRDALPLDRWLLGLPPAGLAFILGLWLAPFVLSTWAHIATFDPSGLRSGDLTGCAGGARPRGLTDAPARCPGIVVAALVYLFATVAIGLWAMRRTRTAADFFIAGRNLGLFVAAIATMSAAFSGFAFLGGPGLTYRLGLASLFICFPVGFTAALLCWTVAKPMRLLGEVRAIYTVPDVILARYRSRLAAGLAAAAVLVGTVFYLARGAALANARGDPRRARRAPVEPSRPRWRQHTHRSLHRGRDGGERLPTCLGSIITGRRPVFVQALHVTGGWGAMTHSCDVAGLARRSIPAW